MDRDNDNKTFLQEKIVVALNENGGRTHHTNIAEWIWDNCVEVHHKPFVLTWSYDLRWAATNLRKQCILKNANETIGQGIWELV